MDTILNYLFTEFYQKSFSVILSEIISLQRQGFKVHLPTPSQETAVFLAKELKTLQESSEIDFPIFLTLEDLRQTQFSTTACSLISYKPIDSELWGFIRLNFPALKATLPSPAKLILRVLEKMNLTAYIDMFDAKAVHNISNLLNCAGLCATIDGIVQFALVSGYYGEEEKAHQELEAYVAKYSNERTQTNQPHSIEELFKKLMQQSSNPHAYLKAALSYYVVKLKGQSISSASRHLNISRSTLLEHLRLAEKMSVQKIFLQSNSPRAIQFNILANQPSQNISNYSN